ncbi:MAG: hypothetical protein P8P26_08510 [Porticoccaceae bacterium]|nr:hypothetical protein [Porticoccaceae bacterium]MDG1312084.1 hypothetical protein [Porticoccaceae bacterium]
MIKILQLSAIITTIFLSVSPFAATGDNPFPEEQIEAELVTPDLSIVERMWAIESIDYKKWSICSGCINTGRISRIRLLDYRTAVIKLLGKKKAILSLATSCPGIKKHGFSYVSNGQRLCTRHTRFEVLGGSYACKVASISPYLELEDPPEQQEFD